MEKSADETAGQYLLQWNSKWKVMNLISGHKEKTDVNYLTCIIREIHEELFSELSFNTELNDLQTKLAAHKEYDLNRDKALWHDYYINQIRIVKNEPFRYIGYSDSAKSWTEYELYIYEVKFQESLDYPLFHKGPFFTPDGRRSPKRPNE